MITMGASEAATALGLDPWGSPVELYLRLSGLLDRYDASPEPAGGASWRGRILEPSLAVWAVAMRGLVMGVNARPGPRKEEPADVHPSCPHLHSHPDVRFYPPGDAPESCEIKTRRVLDAKILGPDGRPYPGWGETGTDVVPRWVATQGCVQLACWPEASRVWVVAFGTMYDDLRCYRLDRRKGLVDTVVGRTWDWYNGHVLAQVPPAPDGRPRTSRALARAIQQAAGGAPVVATDDDLETVRRALALRATVADLQHELERLVQKLKLRMNDATELRRADDTTIATFRGAPRRWRWAAHPEEEYDV